MIDVYTQHHDEDSKIPVLPILFQKIFVALAAFQAQSVKMLWKEQGSFGLCSPRRCELYYLIYARVGDKLCHCSGGIASASTSWTSRIPPLHAFCPHVSKLRSWGSARPR